EDFIFLCISGRKQYNRLKIIMRSKKLQRKTKLMDFIPPWRIPGVLKRSTCVVIPEREFPIASHTPILPREAMCVGRCTLLSEEIYRKCTYKDAEDGLHTLVTNPKDLESFSSTLKRIINEPDIALEIGKAAAALARKNEDFPGYISDNIELYKRILDSE
ncbi:MAG: glycosyltransferase, partial [Thermoplasmata archaeon]